MDQWIHPKVQELAEKIETLRRFAVRYQKTSYSGVAMLFQSEWYYLMRTAPGVREYMGPAEKESENKFLPKLLGLESISGRLRKVLALVPKKAGLRILNLTEVAEERHRTSMACRECLLDSLITVEALPTS